MINFFGKLFFIFVFIFTIFVNNNSFLAVAILGHHSVVSLSNFLLFVYILTSSFAKSKKYSVMLHTKTSNKDI